MGWEHGRSEGALVYSLTASPAAEGHGAHSMSGKKPKALPSLWGVALGALLGALVTTALFTEQGEALQDG